jgi:proteasome lid subunit RPN8/RPN11
MLISPGFHILFPNPSLTLQGTSDTVSMTHEEELFEYCHGEGRSLIVLGWIHTHPRHTCFMSSVDMHTHCGFQTMLPEVRTCCPKGGSCVSSKSLCTTEA